MKWLRQLFAIFGARRIRKHYRVLSGIRTAHDGRRSVDANVLIRTRQAKKHLKGVADIMSKELP